jgi:ribose/xylose/arabinose/galactoside ABC-type transport system permease subunit
VLAALGTGCLVGFVNGALISLLRVVPFIVTLGTMTIVLGIAELVARETTVRPSAEQIPAWLPKMVATRPHMEWLFRQKFGNLFLGIPNVANGVWLLIGLAILMAAVLRYTVFGRYVFAIGSNESTARLCGVNVPLVKIAVYTLSGLFVGIAGMYQFARLSSGEPTSGIGLELKVIAAVVIGGGSLSGGQGTILGTLTGAAVMGAIVSGCTHLQNPLQYIIIGSIIIAAATLDQFRQRRLAQKG